MSSFFPVVHSNENENENQIKSNWIFSSRFPLNGILQTVSLSFFWPPIPISFSPGNVAAFHCEKFNSIRASGVDFLKCNLPRVQLLVSGPCPGFPEFSRSSIFPGFPPFKAHAPNIYPIYSRAKILFAAWLGRRKSKSKLKL